MIATVMTFVFSLWLIIPIALFLLWLAHDDSAGWSLFWLIALSIVVFGTYPIPIHYFFIGLALYLPIGVLWSLTRWKKYCRRRVQDVAEHYGKDWWDTEGSHWLSPSTHISKIINWIVSWPFSLLENIMGDLIDWLVDFVKIRLIFLYDKITADIISDIKKDLK